MPRYTPDSDSDYLQNKRSAAQIATWDGAVARESPDRSRWCSPEEGSPRYWCPTSREGAPQRNKPGAHREDCRTKEGWERANRQSECEGGEDRVHTADIWSVVATSKDHDIRADQWPDQGLEGYWSITQGTESCSEVTEDCIARGGYDPVESYASRCVGLHRYHTSVTAYIITSDLIISQRSLTECIFIHSILDSDRWW
jgi:hypothetical protein